MFFCGTAIAAIRAEVEAKNAREKAWSLLPEDERAAAKIAFFEWEMREREHRKALELARASRPRNWIETLFGS